MTLAWRIRLLLVAFFFLLCVNAALALLNVIVGDRAQDDVERASLGREATNLLLNSLVEQEAGTRGYVITGDEVFVPGTARVAALQLVERLEQIVAGDPRLEERLAAVQEALGAWQRHADDEIAAARAGGPQGAAGMVMAGRQLSQEVQLETRRLRSALQTEHVAAIERLDRSRRRLLNALFTSFFTGALLLVAAALLLRRWITLPLQQVSAAARAVAEGELDRSIPQAGPVDVAALGGDLERMRRRIIDELETAVRAGEALAQHGPAVVSVHAALAPVPVQLPPTVDVAACLLPAEGQLAGDWYDLVLLDRGSVALVVVDVSGHGAEAGVLALRAKQLLLASLRDGRSPGASLDWVAANLGDTEEMFLTAVVVEVDPASGRCRYANAGHPPLLVAGPEGVTELPPTGPLLGPLAGVWSTSASELAPGSVLVAYTDGLVEARDPAGREFGDERLIELVSARRATGPQRIVAACVDAVRETTGGRLDDDLTIVALAITWPPRPEATSPA